MLFSWKWVGEPTKDKRAFAAVGKTGCIASIGFHHRHPHLVPGADDHGGECLLITGIVRAATRLWKQPCDHRPEAPDWCSLFDGGSAFSGRPAERAPFKGLWRPKVSMVVTTVSHCFWTILDGARFYDAGDDSSPRGCTWRGGSSRGQTSRRQVCWPGCSRRGKGSLLPPSQGGCPCLYLL